MIRLEFPDYRGGKESLQPISWEDRSEEFAENELAPIVQETTAQGQTSNFNKLVKRTMEEATFADAYRAIERGRYRSIPSESATRTSVSIRSSTWDWVWAAVTEMRNKFCAAAGRSTGLM